MTDGNAQSKFFLPKELPAPAGTSPFRMKGSIYKYIVTQQVKRLGVGLDEVLKLVTDPKAREFLSQDFPKRIGWHIKWGIQNC
jgi:hypothetical protein